MKLSLYLKKNFENRNQDFASIAENFLENECGHSERVFGICKINSKMLKQVQHDDLFRLWKFFGKNVPFPNSKSIKLALIWSQKFFGKKSRHSELVSESIKYIQLNFEGNSA